MYSYRSTEKMKLKQTAAQKLLNKVLDRSTPVLESGTPEEIHHITSAIKDILDVMSTDEPANKGVKAPKLGEVT